MQEFLTVVFGFPTLPYSIVLAVAVLYWALAAFGLVDDGFGDAGADGALHGDPHDLQGLSALLARWGLGGVPLMLVVTLLGFFAWIVTYFVHLFVLLPLPDLLRWAIGAVVALLAPLPAVPFTALLLRPSAGSCCACARWRRPRCWGVPAWLPRRRWMPAAVTPPSTMAAPDWCCRCAARSNCSVASASC